MPEGFNELTYNCEDVEVRWTLRKEFRYDSPRQRYLEREWQPVPIPERWPWNGQRGSEYALAVIPEPDYDIDPMPRAEAIALAESLGGLPHMPNDLNEWEFVSTLADEYVPVTHLSIGWVGAYQDPNAPDFSEPDGGWYWLTGKPLDPWCNPLTHEEGTAPWHYWSDDPNEPGGGGGGPGPSSEGTPPYRSPVVGSEPDDTVNDDNFVWARKWTNGLLPNWEDVGPDIEDEAAALIERPLLLRDDWRDYDGDSIYADWTVNLAALDGNDVPAPAVVHQRTYLSGVGIIDYSDPNAPLTRVLHADHLGTTRTITDGTSPTAEVVAQFFYNAWGVLEGSTGSAETRYGYVGAQGYQTDPATGLMHLGARYYDPTLGRFLQRDPIGIDGGVNIYSYVSNDPVTKVDPTGRCWACDYGARTQKAGGAVAGYGAAIWGWGKVMKRPDVAAVGGAIAMGGTAGAGAGVALESGGKGYHWYMALPRGRRPPEQTLPKWRMHTEAYQNAILDSYVDNLIRDQQGKLFPH